MKNIFVLCFLAIMLSYGQTEKHLANIKQLTFSGTNAEAYFSSDGRQLIYQATRDQYQCDQIFTMNVDGTNDRLVSTGEGRTTCAYFYPDGKHILYASTHEDDDDCPPPPDRSKGYVWGVFNSYDIYRANADGSDLEVLTASKGYDAEATISPDGRHIVFTSSRDGDLELYIMNADGSNVRRLTFDKGYDGGAFFSPDGKRIVYRAHHPSDSADLRMTEELLQQQLVKPSQMELFIINADGSGKRQITHNGAANFAPYFTPDGTRIIFSSNMHDPKGYNFDLFLVDIDGRNLEQVTFDPGFDSFPMFSPDGKKLVFESMRNGKTRHEINIFMADWVHDSTALYSKRNVDTLASDALEGRATGEPGNVLASKYVADAFEHYGLMPVGDSGTFYQHFEVVTSIELGNANALKAVIGKKKKTYALTKDFIPVSFSSNATVSGPVVFAGYGITSAEEKYDDYAKLDVTGKIVVVLRYSPDGDSPHSKFSKESSLRYKALQAREKGAKALIVVTASADDSTDGLIALKYDHSMSDAAIPILSVTRATANEWLASAKTTVDAYHDAIGTSKSPFPILPKRITVTLTTDLTQIKKPTANVIGLLKVSDSSSHLIVGAHFDHLGYGGVGSGSLTPDLHEIHNGADDNASGTSAMLEMARHLSMDRSVLKRNVLFIGFTGEEMGTLGSLHYTKHPVMPLTDAITMLNFDMVGRLRDRALTVQGTGTSSRWDSLLSRHNADSTFHLKFVPDGFGPSDHSPFYAQNIPVLFFFTGLHDDYHRPSDDADKIDHDGIAQIVRFGEQLAVDIDTTGARPDYLKTASPPQGTGRGFKVFVGTIPDYSEGADGMLLAGVRENSPAAKGGMRKGDVLVKFGRFDIKNVYDYTYALQEYKAGDAVEIQYRRGSEVLTATITLEKRN